MDMTPSRSPFHLLPGVGDPIAAIGTLKVSASQTGGAFEVIEFAGPEAPPHVHRAREEVFFVLAGAFTFTLEDESVPAASGSLVFVPRGVRHGFRRTEGSKALVIVAPAGLEPFFRELGAGMEAGRSPADLRRELAGRHDAEPA